MLKDVVNQAQIPADEVGAFRWPCTAANPIVNLPLRRELTAGKLRCRLMIAEEPKSVVSPLIRFMREERQAVAVHYNSVGRTLALDNGDNEEIHIRTGGRATLEFELEIEELRLYLDLGRGRRPVGLSRAPWKEFSSIRLGANHGLPPGWGPPVGTSFMLFNEGLMEEVEPIQPPPVRPTNAQVVTELHHIRESIGGLIERLS